MGNFKTRYLPWGELPQNTLGRIVSRQWKKRLERISNEKIEAVKNLELRYDLKIYIVTNESHKADKHLKGISGFALGKYICLPDSYNLNLTVPHEGGHTLQSEKLGWLYLPIVGISSAIFNNLWDRWFHKKWPGEKRYKWYYNRFPEKWADELGSVKRTYVEAS